MREFAVKKIILFLSLASIISAAPAFAAAATIKPPAKTVAAPVPCATMAVEVDEAMKATKVKGAKLVSAGRHYKAGLALCKVEKDLNADIQFSMVLKLLGL